MPTKPHHPDDTVLFELTSTLQPIRRAWSQACTVVLADFQLPSSLAAAVILASRRGDEGIRQSALAEEVGVNPGGMVRILDQAATAGLLERRDSTDDRRVKTVHVLPKGQELATKMEEAIAKLRGALLGDLPPDDIETARRVLRLFEGQIAAFLRQNR